MRRPLRHAAAQQSSHKVRTMKSSLKLSTCAVSSLVLAAAAYSQSLRADDLPAAGFAIKGGGHHHGAVRANGQAPIGVMGEHLHKKGEWMLSYRFMRMNMEGNRIGADAVSPEQIVTTVPNLNSVVTPNGHDRRATILARGSDHDDHGHAHVRRHVCAHKQHHVHGHAALTSGRKWTT